MLTVNVDLRLHLPYSISFLSTENDYDVNPRATQPITLRELGHVTRAPPNNLSLLYAFFKAPGVMPTKSINFAATNETRASRHGLEFCGRLRQVIISYVLAKQIERF
jgi:hypothetical protein